jgi:hypothetical protein
MKSLERPIVATLAYYGAFQWPLTLTELHERLVPGTRLDEHRASRPNLHELAEVTETLVAAGTIRTALGMYGPADMNEEVFTGRVAREKEQAQKWRRVRRYAWWLQGVPYVRALLGSGSLALGNTGPDSDWDVFVIARRGRLYTARAFLLATAFLMRRLRTKRDSVAPDKFCFNHYVTTDGLAIRHRSLFTAHAICWLVPLHDPYGYLGRLRQANTWIHDFVPGDSGTLFVRRQMPRSRLLGAMHRMAEAILNTMPGDWLERGLRRWQRGRIMHEPITHERGGRVIADDRELEFHPHSAERLVLDRYNAALAGLGVKRRETDSGLTK